MADYLNTPNPLKILVALPERVPAPVKAIFKASPEKASVGQPGKQAGDVVLVAGEELYTAIVSVGSQSKRSAETFRQAGGGLARWLKQTNTSVIDIDLAGIEDFGVPDALSGLLEGLFLGSFQFNRRKSKTDPAVDTQVALRGALDPAQVAETVAHAQIQTFQQT
jgi:leucyl aminopeptidase